MSTKYREKEPNRGEKKDQPRNSTDREENSENWKIALMLEEKKEVGL